MRLLFAYAEGADTTDSSLMLVVIALVIAGAACVLAAIPITTARRRRLGKTEGIAAIMVLWGLITAGGAVYTVNAQMAWSKEYALRLQSGYLNARDQGDRPPQPWALWGAVAVVYGAAVVWSFTARPFVPPSPPAGFEVITPSPPEEPRD